MEDNIVQHYPRQIVMVKELIEKLEQDIALYEQNAATSKDKFHMQVGSGVYDTRKDAGNAIIKWNCQNRNISRIFNEYSIRFL